MIQYVVCLPFNESKSHVVLIEKTHPKWQAGKWNGPGGHIEPGEEINQAAQRECAEEVGLTTSPEDWRHFLTLFNFKNDWEVYFLSTFMDIEVAKTLTDERAVITPVRALWFKPIIPNLRWIIPLALDETGLSLPIEIEDRGEI
jgi:8-oxo-dGTP diphosphatase